MDQALRPGAKRHRVSQDHRASAGRGALGQHPQDCAGAVGRAHRAFRRCGGGQRRSGRLLRLHESDSRREPHRSHCRVSAGRGHRAFAERCRRKRLVLPGRLRLGRFQSDWRQYRHQCRRNQGDSLRHDTQLGGRHESRHRQGRCAGTEQRPDQERHRLRPASAVHRR
ncbi:hypothetical protein D3C72_1500950 [compost metagenome]